MRITKLHSDEADIDLSLVRQLLREQFPQWADLELEPLRPQGTDNAMFKLGDDKVVRLPRTPSSAANIAKESEWLSRLSPLLPIAVPTPLGTGHPSAGYPFSWLVSSWIEGVTPDSEMSLDQHHAAIDLGSFVAAIRRISPMGAPQCNRGLPLQVRDAATRAAIFALSDAYDARELTTPWETALAAPQWKGLPAWMHGDLHAGNVLAQNGRVTGVVDFGLAGVGDPACDLMVAWTLLTADTRALFRSIVQPDDATWARGRGWALHFGIVAYPYYRMSNPALAAAAKRSLDEVLADRDFK